MTASDLLRRMVAPLASRKVRVALATVLAAFAAEWGLEVPQELILTIVGVGAALILGIAHEDAGRNARPVSGQPSAPAVNPSPAPTSASS